MLFQGHRQRPSSAARLSTQLGKDAARLLQGRCCQACWPLEASWQTRRRAGGGERASSGASRRRCRSAELRRRRTRLRRVLSRLCACVPAFGCFCSTLAPCAHAIILLTQLCCQWADGTRSGPGPCRKAQLGATAGGDGNEGRGSCRAQQLDVDRCRHPQGWSCSGLASLAAPRHPLGGCCRQRSMVGGREGGAAGSEPLTACASCARQGLAEGAVRR